MKKTSVIAALRCAALLCAATTLGASVWWISRETEPSGGGESVQATSPQATPASWLVSGVYRLDAEASVEGPRGAAFQLGLLGKLRVNELGRQGNVWIERWQFLGQVESTTLAEDEVASLEEALKRPFFVEWTAGLVSGLRFAGDTLRPAQTTWRSLVTLTQYQPSGEPLWQAQEQDASGTYLAQYERTGDRTSKTKLRYVNVRAENVSLRLLHSASVFTSSDGLRSLSASEEIETSSKLLPVPMRGLLRFDLDDRQPAEAVEPEWLREYNAAEALALSGAGTETSIAGELDRAKARGFTWETAAAALHGDPKGKGYTRAYQALTALLRVDSSVLDQVVKGAATDGPLRATLLAALGDAGTAEAQSALRKFLGDAGFSDEHRLVMARGLSRTTAPTAETVQFLANKVRDPVLGQQARLGLGSNVARLQQSDPELAKQTLETIGTGLKSASGAERGDYLGALGNSRDPAALPLIRPYLSDPSATIAARATFALRHLPGATTDILLAEQLDPSRPLEVRESALGALRDRQPRSPLLEQVSALMLTEPNDRVRGAAIELGSFWAGRSALLQSSLAQVAAQEANPNLKSIAVAGIQRLAAAREL